MQPLIGMLAVLDTTPTSMVDSFANNNLLFSSIEIMLGAFAGGIAMKYRLKEWKVAVIIGLITFTVSVCHVILSRSTSFSALVVLKQTMPFLAVAIWMLSASYFRHRINRALSDQETVIAALSKRIDEMQAEAAHQHEELTDIAGRLREMPKIITSAIRNYDQRLNAAIADNIVSTDEMPDRTRAISPITVGQIIEDLGSCPPLEKRSHAQAYLGNFVKWDCKIVNLSRSGKQIDVKLIVERPIRFNEENFIKFINTNNAIISISLPESENPHLKLMKEQESVAVDGCIKEIRVSPTISITLGNATISVTRGV